MVSGRYSAGFAVPILGHAFPSSVRRAEGAVRWSPRAGFRRVVAALSGHGAGHRPGTIGMTSADAA